MLVLTRRANESIVIGDGITVVVIEVRGDRVRLGIEAPRGSTVHRSEVWAAIHGVPAAPPQPISPVLFTPPFVPPPAPPPPPPSPPPPQLLVKRISG